MTDITQHDIDDCVEEFIEKNRAILSRPSIETDSLKAIVVAASELMTTYAPVVAHAAERLAETTVAYETYKTNGEYGSASWKAAKRFKACRYEHGQKETYYIWLTWVRDDAYARCVSQSDCV